MNALIGAISSNYSINDIKRWVESSKIIDGKRILLLYNTKEGELVDYLKSQDVEVLAPDFDYWGHKKDKFEVNTANANFNSTYDLIHNSRFLHIYYSLFDTEYEKVLITDVKDVYFNSDPFIKLSKSKITATSEVITYNNHEWNKNHALTNLGILGTELLGNEVYNVGVFGGGLDIVRKICRDIYLLSVGKPKVADQTSFNYLINTLYKDHTNFTGLNDYLAVHLHVVSEGKVNFNFKELDKYPIVHQYDRFNGKI